MNREGMSEADSLVDMLVAVRNALLQAVDAINQYINSKAPPTVKAEELKASFPEGLRQLLHFEEQGSVLIVRPKAYLGAENFAKVADVVRKHNGRYVSQGKESHFEVPLTAMKTL